MMAETANKLVQFLLIFYYWFEAIVLFFIPQRFRFKSVKGLTVLITGSANGLGRELSVGFAKRGASLVVWDIDEVAIEETVRLVSVVAPEVKVKGYVCDVSNREMVFKVTDRVKHDMGSVDILVNNAGVCYFSRFLEQSEHMIERTINVNLLSQFWTIKAFLPDMIKNKQGHIVTIASLAGFAPLIEAKDYSASKHALVGLHESLDMELYRDGLNFINTTLVVPYFINTELIKGMKKVPLLPPIKVKDVAEKTISGVLSNTKIILVPKTNFLTIFLKVILPVKSYQQLYRLVMPRDLGKGFVGREYRKKN